MQRRLLKYVEKCLSRVFSHFKRYCSQIKSKSVEDNDFKAHVIYSNDMTFRKS